VPHAHEAARQHVQEEPADEFLGIDREQPSPVAAPAIAIGKADAALIESTQALVADGNPVGVAAQIVQHLSGAGPGRLAVDDPLSRRGLTK